MTVEYHRDESALRMLSILSDQVSINTQNLLNLISEFDEKVFAAMSGATSEKMASGCAFMNSSPSEIVFHARTGGDTLVRYASIDSQSKQHGSLNDRISFNIDSNDSGQPVEIVKIIDSGLQVIRGNITGNVIGTVSDISNFTTNDLSEGNANLYYTDARARAANAADIATNATNIASNTTNIATNTSNIATNTSNIATNTSNIASNTTNIASNTTNIATNTSNIASNTTNIATNTSNIASNTTNIASNTSNIATNTSNIATNTSNIATNTTNIASNTSNIATNTSNIATNTTAITSLQEDIDDLDTRVGTNTTNIASNTTNIASNTAAIAALGSGSSSLSKVYFRAHGGTVNPNSASSGKTSNVSYDLAPMNGAYQGATSYFASTAASGKFNTTTGVFTAPRDGVFVFHVCVHFLVATGDSLDCIYLWPMKKLSGTTTWLSNTAIGGWVSGGSSSDAPMDAYIYASKIDKLGDNDTVQPVTMTVLEELASGDEWKWVVKAKTTNGGLWGWGEYFGGTWFHGHNVD